MLMLPRVSAALAALMLAATARCENFTIINGQIFTPGLVIVDAPQPNTPLGGETLHITLEVSGNGKLGLPPYGDSAPSGIHSIHIFMTSYTTGKNLTVSNGTALSATAADGGGGVIMSQEPGSTVKHVNWLWPGCLVEFGHPKIIGRGAYNISIHQAFRLNDTEYYSIFNLPFALQNNIPENANRSTCESLMNPMLPWDEVVESTVVLEPSQYPWTDGTGVQVNMPNGSSGGGNGGGDGIGGSKPNADAGDGLGNGAGMVNADGRLAALAIIFAVALASVYN